MMQQKRQRHRAQRLRGLQQQLIRPEEIACLSIHMPGHAPRGSRASSCELCRAPGRRAQIRLPI